LSDFLQLGQLLPATTFVVVSTSAKRFAAQPAFLPHVFRLKKSFRDSPSLRFNAFLQPGARQKRAGSLFAQVADSRLP
jgi:hypothetical protein